MARYRVYELAYKYSIDSKTAMDILKKSGVDVETHVSAVSEKDIEKVNEILQAYCNKREDFENELVNPGLILENIALKNFRCFGDVKIDFRPDYTILVGINGAGKTAILDAIAIALGGYLAGFDGVISNNITKWDAYRKFIRIGNKTNVERQYPVVITANAKVANRDICWLRQMKGEKSTKIKAGAEDIIYIASIVQKRIREGSADIVLPLVSYYGTDRLRNQNVGGIKNVVHTEASRLNGYDSCLKSVIDMRRLAEWFADMTYVQLQEGHSIQELETVRNAMERCYLLLNGAVEECSIVYKVKEKTIEITSSQEASMPLTNLSDGYKSILFMVADIAYRMSVLNPQLKDRIIIETPGIVLIDEIDLHLHPSWQKNIIQVLRQIFPKVQFIVTTHSPSVLANIRKEHLILLYDRVCYEAENEIYGKDADSILSEIMGVDVRPDEVRDLIKLFQDTLDSDVERAEKYLNDLRMLVGDTSKDVIQGEIALDFERTMKG